MRKHTKRKVYRANHPLKDKIILDHLDKTIRDLKIRFYLASDGDDATPYLAELAHVLTPICVGGSIQFGRETPWVRQLHGALRTLQAMCLDGYRWNAANAAPLNAALEVALANMRVVDLKPLMQGIEEGVVFASYISNHLVTKETVSS
jgi:hypothetical protein